MKYVEVLQPVSIADQSFVFLTLPVPIKAGSTQIFPENYPVQVSLFYAAPYSLADCFRMKNYKKLGNNISLIKDKTGRSN